MTSFSVGIISSRRMSGGKPRSSKAGSARAPASDRNTGQEKKSTYKLSISETQTVIYHWILFHGLPSELWRRVLAFMRKAVRKRSRLLKPAGLGSLEGLSSMESTLPISFFPVPTDSLALGRRTRSSKLSFWLK